MGMSTKTMVFVPTMRSSVALPRGKHMTQKKTPTKRSNGAGKKETAKAAPKQASSKARVRKVPAAPTAETVPYTMSDEEIEQRAYFLWENRGRPIGSPDEDWHTAKKQHRP